MKTQENGVVSGVIFTVSNDGGKTGVYWRENVFECLEYHEKYYKEHGTWQVVAVRKNVDKTEKIK